jgi:NAD(P)-dependent dehydrogenase (short-subunit alcohol dehydrogenase family)
MPATSRRVLVTGAGRGIGRAIAERFLAGGWTVGFYDVDAAAAAGAAGGRERAVHGGLDVREELQWRDTLEAFCGAAPLDVLVNNAGVLSSGPFARTSLAEHRRMLDVNVLGSITGALMAHDHLARSAAPVLLNLCSASALYGQASLATYGATKSAVKSLTEALDLEWADEGIRVRSLMPLFVDTDMVSGDMLRLASVRRLGVRLTPDDVAEKAWRVVQERPNPVRGPHRAVGVQTQVLASVSAVSPTWVSRLIARSIAV